MRKFRRACAYALTTAAVSAAAITTAAAACTVAGTWHVFLMQGQTPNIVTQQTQVRAPTGTGQTTITVFPNSGHQYDNQTAVAIQCRLVLTAAGRFTNDPCSAHGVVPGDGGDVNVTGRLIFGTGANACRISGGSITLIDSEDPAVTVLGGYVNGDHGAGIARQGDGSVFLFNMVKQAP